MKKEYLLSIVVPTKDRYYYLKHLIMLIQGFKSEDIELVIQDNTENNEEIRNFIANLNYPDLYYYHIDEPLSVSDNSTKAILNSHGEYVCFIGDDDGVTRHIVECVKWMKQNDIKVLKSQYALYKWPSFPNGRYVKLSGTTAVSKYSCTYKYIDCKKMLRRLLKEGMRTLEYMPKVYNGIVKREALDKIIALTGTYFPGPSPDMANAVALALLVDKYVYLDFPIIIGGMCKHVGGDVRHVKGGYKAIKDVPFLPNDSEETWEKCLPKVWCVETVWPESAIKAIRKLGQNQYLNDINTDYLLARFIANRPDIQYLATPLITNRLYTKIVTARIRIYKKLNSLISLLNYLIFKKDSDNLKVYHGFETIIECEKYIFKKNSFFTIK